MKDIGKTDYTTARVNYMQTESALMANGKKASMQKFTTRP